MRANRLRELWAGGKPATNFWLGLPSMLSAEIVSHQGWDSLTVDMQHGHIGYESMVAMLLAISTTEGVPRVRVPWNESVRSHAGARRWHHGVTSRTSTRPSGARVSSAPAAMHPKVIAASAPSAPCFMAVPITSPRPTRPCLRLCRWNRRSALRTSPRSHR